MDYRLAEDIKSNFYHNKVNIIYGQRGEKVKEISRSEHVVIVEDKKGERFPVHDKQLILTNK